MIFFFIRIQHRNFFKTFFTTQLVARFASEAGNGKYPFQYYGNYFEHVAMVYEFLALSSEKCLFFISASCILSLLIKCMDFSAKQRVVIGIDASRYASKYPTGVELYTNKIIEGLLHSDRRHKDNVIYRLYVRDLSHIDGLKHLLSDEDEVTVIDSPRLWTQVGLTRELKRVPVDLLFVPSHVLPRVPSQKTVMVVHGLESSHFPKAYSPFVRWYQKWSTRYAVTHASCLIAVSHAVRSDLRRFYDCFDEKIRVVYEGCGSLGSPPHSDYREPWILSVGRIEERKNQLRLIRAFEKFHETHSDWKLILAGPDGFGAGKVHSYVRSLNVPVRDSIRFLGHVPHDKVMRLMAGASIFAYPSLAEGFGLPILEAFSVGIPVLTSHSSACAEIAGDAALTVDPFDSESIARGLVLLADDSHLKARMTSLGFERLRVFSWEKCIQETEDVLFSFL
jgi:glycosyltransferase involved in cell wall biosynthesis